MQSIVFAPTYPIKWIYSKIPTQLPKTVFRKGVHYFPSSFPPKFTYLVNANSKKTPEEPTTFSYFHLRSVTVFENCWRQPQLPQAASFQPNAWGWAGPKDLRYVTLFKCSPVEIICGNLFQLNLWHNNGIAINIRAGLFHYFTTQESPVSL